MDPLELDLARYLSALGIEADTIEIGLDALVSRSAPLGTSAELKSLWGLFGALLLLDQRRLSERPAHIWLGGVVGQIYASERAQGLPPVASRLGRALLLASEGRPALALKHVVGLRSTELALPEAGESLLCWVAFSASLQLRDLLSAEAELARWQALPERDAGIAPPPTLVATFFARLRGVTDQPAGAVPAPWTDTAERLARWEAPPTVDPAPTTPFVLGVRWCRAMTLDQALAQADSLAGVCALRRLPNSGLLDVDETTLVQILRALARWDLHGPLDEALRLIRGPRPQAFYSHLVARHLGPRAARALDPSLGGVIAKAPRRLDDVLILMSDVQGYADLSRDLPPTSLHAMLSPIFKLMHEALEPLGGQIHEFVGDSIMVVFDPGPDPGALQDVFNAAAACLRRVDQSATLTASRAGARLKLGVGLHRGPVGRGHLGGLERCHLAYLGDTVNVAARLESLTRTLPTRIAVSAETMEGLALWEAPQRVHCRLRDLGPRTLKGVSERRVIGIEPLTASWIDFVPMGFVARPEPGVVYLDTGNALEPGVVDNHVEGSRASTCASLLERPELLLDHLAGTPHPELRVHSNPDLDCAASVYAAEELLGGQPRQRLLATLADYLDQVDAGHVPNPERLADSLYGVFQAHQYRVRGRGEADDLAQLEAGVRVVDATMFLAEREGHLDFSTVFAARPAWFSAERDMIRADQALYLEDRERATAYSAPVGGLSEPAQGLWLDHPRSLFFKHWVRTDPDAPGGRGYPFMVVDWSRPDLESFVISVEPDSGLHLRGLGQALEALERQRRVKLGRERPREPKRLPADNSDPWYFGQGHHYTIVAGPRCGTLLSGAEVRQAHADWRPGEPQP